jgi:agmatine deiminase
MTRLEQMTERSEASAWTSADAPVGRMPAEWEPHAGCFMGWPANPKAWGRDLADVQRDYVAVAQAIRRFEPVTMLVEPDAVADARRQLGTDIAIIPLPLNEAWLRDSGPSFVKRPDGALAGVAWRFNGWGGASPDFAPDTLVARRLLGILGLPVASSALAFEGGALHVDGEGTLLTTETVVFAKNRNPGITRAAAEAEFARTLGIAKTIWLPGNPYEKGTDGHIDGIACFVRPGRVLFETSASSREELRGVTERNRRALEGQTDARGRALEFDYVQEAPDLARGTSEGWGYSTSYVNFYIANGGVVMPKFGVPADDAARAAIAAAFPDRVVVQVDISTLAGGGGGIHCVTQQQPV